MTIRTSKACAGPAIERKPGANASNDIDYHLRRGRGGGVKSLTAKAQSTAASPFFTPPQVRKLFFGVPHPMINR
ncbi:hypothetical protein, partial [Klebsiella pneumoniae]|uniref:hypothetical protein n=1 Tax=Klebsiella pneumoniae TaxID=573 RepID=UPI001B8B8320